MPVCHRAACPGCGHQPVGWLADPPGDLPWCPHPTNHRAIALLPPLSARPAPPAHPPLPIRAVDPVCPSVPVPSLASFPKSVDLPTGPDYACRRGRLRGVKHTPRSSPFDGIGCIRILRLSAALSGSSATIPAIPLSRGLQFLSVRGVTSRLVFRSAYQPFMRFQSVGLPARPWPDVFSVSSAPPVVFRATGRSVPCPHRPLSARFGGLSTKLCNNYTRCDNNHTRFSHQTGAGSSSSSSGQQHHPPGVSRTFPLGLFLCYILLQKKNLTEIIEKDNPLGGPGYPPPMVLSSAAAVAAVAAAVRG